MQPVLRLHLLGPFHIETAQPPPRGFGAKAKAMLCYLALESRPVPKPLLEKLFWPDALDRSSLNRELTHLRKVATNGLIAEDDTIQIDRSIGVWLDTELFATLVKQGGTTALTQAMALYHGEFMAGFDLENCPDFDEWLRVQRTYWHEQAVDLLTKLVDRHRGSSEVLKFARILLVLEPWREEVQRAIMLILGRRKQWNTASKQYINCCQVMEQEFKAAPSPETTRLHQRIEAARKLVTPALPAELTPLIGPTIEVDHLSEQLIDPVYQQVTLIGFGGMGKTRLALATAKALAHAFLEGVYFVSLTATSQATLAIMLADALPIPLTSHQTPQAQLIRYLRTKELLLILDGFEHLLSEAGLLADILEQAPGVKMLVTSRQRLAIRGERLFEVASLTYPIPDPMTNSMTNGGTEILETYSAVTLFLQLARDVQANFPATHVENAAIVHICQLTMGVPLAIELAAATLPDHSYPKIVAALENSLRFLDNRRRGGHPRQQSMWATLAYSWNLLTPEEQRIMRRLSVFAGSFPVAAAHYVANAGPAVFVGLVSKFFLRSTDDRYIVHELIREFSREQLAEDLAEESAARNQHKAWFVELLSEHNLIDAKLGESDTLRAIEQEIANIRLAWEWAAEQNDLVTLEQTLLNLFYYYFKRGKDREIYELIEQTVLTIDVQVPLTLQSDDQRNHFLGKLLWRQASAAFTLGRPEQARQLCQQGIALLRQVGELEEMVRALNNLALVAHNTGLLENAEQLYRECLSLHGSLEPANQGIFGARINLGLLYRTWGRLREAEQLFQDCLVVAIESENQGLKAYALGVLGLVACDLGKYSEARPAIVTSQTLFSDLGDEYGVALSKWHMGMVLRYQGEYSEGKQKFIECQATFERIGYNLGSIYPRLGLAEIARVEGDYSAARQLVIECLPILEQANEPTQIGVCYHTLGKIALQQRQLDEAEQFFQQSLALHKPHNCRPDIAVVYCGLGQIAIQTGNRHLAEQFLFRALTIAWETQAQPLITDILVPIAELMKTDQKQQTQTLNIIHCVLNCHGSKEETKAQARILLQWLESRPAFESIRTQKIQTTVIDVDNLAKLVQNLLHKLSRSARDK